MHINLDELEQEILHDFYEHNVLESNPEILRQVAEVSARITIIALAKFAERLEVKAAVDRMVGE